MAAENVRYRTYQECLDSLKRMGVDGDEYGLISSLLEHEREHFEKAVELGYRPLYGIRMVADRPPIVLAGFIDFDGNVPQGRDMVKILLAPDSPSDDDLRLVERINREMG